jgi:hypothetical protein
MIGSAPAASIGGSTTRTAALGVEHRTVRHNARLQMALEG